MNVAEMDDRVKAIAEISPVIKSFGLLGNYRRPKFFISGINDESIDSTKLESVIKGLPDPKKYQFIPGATHFWTGYEKQIGASVASFFAEFL